MSKSKQNPETVIEDTSNTDKHYVGLYLNQDDWDALEKQCEEESRNKAGHIRKLIRDAKASSEDKHEAT